MHELVKCTRAGAEAQRIMCHHVDQVDQDVDGEEQRSFVVVLRITFHIETGLAGAVTQS
jgi:uncharacterized tellurite resistance protein B-like protein